ncbi:hypothetical protein [uncultured Aquimarina sp.]|uniref:hypothetical protein n=1 Tax=uncultured Aquimarina sp. TaxID=575652 RepID=UPI00262256F6|nr:hypothetical protein [uncultured Aquimarina sp.]
MAVKNKIQISGDVIIDHDQYLITAKPNGLIKLSLEELGDNEEKSETIKWLSHWFHGTPDIIKQDTQFHLKNKLNLRVEEVYSGGGLGWIEPFKDGDTPLCKAPHGYFFNCMGSRSIDRIEWREYQTDDNGPLVDLDEGKHYGQGVQLHIYTTGLYGQELQVYLRDVRKVNADLTADTDFKDDSKDNIKEYFGAEVDVYIDEQGNKVQKAIITINIEHRWRVLASGWFSSYGLDIVPIVRTTLDNVDHGDFTGSKYELPVEVPIRGTKIEAPEVVKSGNNPVIIEKIETNPAEFHPCRYEKILVSFEEDNEEKTLTLYDSKDQGRKDELEYPIVVGTDQKRKRFKIQLEDVNTDDCRFLGKNNEHKNHVIDITSLQKKIDNGYGTRSKQWRGGNTEDLAKEVGLPTGEVKNKKGDTLINGEIKTEKSGDQNDDRIIDASHITNQLDIVGKIMKINGKKSFNILEKHRPFILEQPTDELLELEVGYDFTFGGSKHYVMGLLTSMIPNRQAAIQKYPLVVETCARTHPLDILVVPDTKCTIQLAFNYDLKQYNLVREAYHQKWKRRELEAEDVKKRLEAKRDKSQAIHMDKYLAAEEAKGKKKKKLKREEEKYFNKKVANKNKKIKEANKKLKKAKSKTSKSGQLSKAIDLLEMDDAIENKILDIEFTAIVEFDRPYGAIEVTPHFAEIVNFLKKIVDIKEMVEGIINGKNSDTTKKSPKGNSKRTDNLKKALDKKKKTGVKKSNWSFEFLDPSIAVSFSWHAERPKDLNKPVMGTMFTGVIDMNPLFGFQIKYDVYQLLYKIKHPAVLAIVATLDVLDELAGDNFDIDLDLIVTSEISGTMMGMINTVPGSKYIDRLKEDEDDTPAKVGGAVNIVLEGKIQVNGEFESFMFGKYNAYGEVSASVETGISMEFVTKANQEMLYIEPEIKFEGLILKGNVKAGITKVQKKIKEKDRKSDDDYEMLENEAKQTTEKLPSSGDPIEALEKEQGIHYKTHGEIIVLDPYEWEITKWQIPLYKFK